MSWDERLFNLSVSASVIFWAGMNVREMLLEQFSVVRTCLVFLHLSVGGLFLRRSPLKKSGATRDLLFVTVAFVAGGIAFRLSPAPQIWPAHSQALFAAGTGIAIVSLLFLGRSFAVMPALREIVSLGPYRVVRHPVYLGELTMLLGACTSIPNPWMPAIFAVAVGGVVLRIRAEEFLLRHDPNYLDYAQNIRWRLLPFLW